VMPMRERSRLEDELIAARNAAQEAAAAKDRFLSIVSHELRSPLAGVAGFSDLLLRRQTGELTDRQRHYVERIRDAASYQVGLIEDILEFAAIVGERRAMAPAPISVERVVVRAESLLKLRATEAGHSIERAPVPAPGQVIADAGGVQQILLNLGVNAIKYSPPGTPIEFRIEGSARRVRFSIRDRGPGIPPDDLDRIFQPFVRLESTRGPGSRHGVGLGLSISRDLAQAMGGEISVESVLGEGATFTLDLPAA
jgi:signal transduction histidine kinase